MLSASAAELAAFGVVVDFFEDSVLPESQKQQSLFSHRMIVSSTSNRMWLLRLNRRRET
jgi:hypothetical protein